MAFYGVFTLGEFKTKHLVLFIVDESRPIDDRMSTTVKRALLGLALFCSLAFAGYFGFLMLAQAERGEPVSHLAFRVGLLSILSYWFGYHLKEAFREDAGAENSFASIVVLWREPQLVTAEGVRRAAEAALGVSIGPDAVTGNASSVLWRHREHLFLIHNQRGAYHTAAIKDARCIPDAALREALDSYRGWMSVELIQYPEGASVEDSYRMMGPLVAELTGTQAAALFVAGAGFWAVWEEALADMLRGPDPLAAFDRGGVAVSFDVPDEEPALVRAAEEARRRWPEFVAAFRSRSRTQSYYVRIRLEDDEEQGFPWLSVSEVREDGVVGTLDAETATISYPPGMPIEGRLEDIWDWMIVPAGGAAPIGYFAQEALSNA